MEKSREGDKKGSIIGGKEGEGEEIKWKGRQEVKKDKEEQGKGDKGREE